MTPTPYQPKLHRCEKCGGPVVPLVPPVKPKPYEEALVEKRNMLVALLVGMPEGSWRFLETLLSVDGYYRTTGDLARDVAINQSTLTSRFYRLGLPSPKQIILHVYLWRVLMNAQRISGSIVESALAHHASSGQSFNRSCRKAFGVTPRKLLEQMTPDQIFQKHVVDVLIIPHLATWRTVDMLSANFTISNRDLQRVAESVPKYEVKRLPVSVIVLDGPALAVAMRKWLNDAADDEETRWLLQAGYLRVAVGLRGKLVATGKGIQAATAPFKVSENAPPPYRAGDMVVWLHTEGGGGGSGHRMNVKTPRVEKVVAVTKKSVKLAASGRGDGTWVRRSNVLPLVTHAWATLHHIANAVTVFEDRCDEDTTLDEAWRLLHDIRMQARLTGNALGPSAMAVHEDSPRYVARCSTCMKEDGTLNVELLDAEGTCTFGCGHKVDRDTGMCPNCLEHSAPFFECPDCGRGYERWDEGWEPDSSGLSVFASPEQAAMKHAEGWDGKAHRYQVSEGTPFYASSPADPDDYLPPAQAARAKALVTIVARFPDAGDDAEQWFIPHLTPADIFAIAAAMDVACDDEDEPYPGLFEAQRKVLYARQQLLARGIEEPQPTALDVLHGGLTIRAVVEYLRRLVLAECEAIQEDIERTNALDEPNDDEVR